MYADLSSEPDARYLREHSTNSCGSRERRLERVLFRCRWPFAMRAADGKDVHGRQGSVQPAACCEQCANPSHLRQGLKETLVAICEFLCPVNVRTHRADRTSHSLAVLSCAAVRTNDSFTPWVPWGVD